MSAKSYLAPENLDTIPVEYRCQREELKMIPRAPQVPEKKFKTKLACDASSTGPDLVSV